MADQSNPPPQPIHTSSSMDPDPDSETGTQNQEHATSSAAVHSLPATLPPRTRISPFRKYAHRLPEVWSLVAVIQDLLSGGLRVEDPTGSILDSVSTSLFASQSHIYTLAIFRSIQKILAQAGVETSHTSLGLPHNAAVAEKFTTAIGGPRRERT